MDNQNKVIQSYVTALFFSTLLLLGFSFTGPVKANPVSQGEQRLINSIQLAHGGPRGHRHRGYYPYRHWRHSGGIYIGPQFRHRGAHWTGWRVYHRYGRRCARQCLVNRMTGQVIRCQRRCWR